MKDLRRIGGNLTKSVAISEYRNLSRGEGGGGVEPKWGPGDLPLMGYRGNAPVQGLGDNIPQVGEIFILEATKSIYYV